MRRRLIPLALIAGTLVPAIGASPATAQLCEILGNCPPTTTSTTTTTTTAPPTTTTTTTAPTTTTTSSTTTTTTTTTTTSTTTTTTSSTTTTSTSSTTSTTIAAGASSGGLSVSAPTSALLSGGTPVSAGSLSATLGEVEVVDARTGLARTWVAIVSCSDFTTGAASPAETIAKANVQYWSGPATGFSGIAVLVPGQLTSAGAVSLSSSQTAFSATGVTGSATARWTPTIRVQLPSSAVVGEYRGTVTHSVA